MRTGIAAIAFVVVSALATADAAAQSRDAAECVGATERGQAKRDDGHLLASRAEFLACASDACPAVVRRECLRWLAEVDARIPSLVVSATDSNGHDVAAAEVWLDGVQLPNAGLGRAFKVDPGAHGLRVSGLNVDPVSERIVVREREQERVVKLVLRARGPVLTVTGSRPPAVQRARAVPTASWVLGGVALVGAAGFGIFWARGMSKVSDLRGSCSPYCSSDQIDDARSALAIARVSGGMGIAAAVGAVVVYLVTPPAIATASAPGTMALAF